MEWWHYALMISGAAFGGWSGVKMTVAVLKTEVAQLKEEIKSLRADRHKHANLLQDHEARLSFLERE